MDDFVRINVRGTRNVLDAAGSRRAVVLASVAGWGYEFTRDLDEDALPRPCGIPYIDTKGATETLALRRGATVIRPGDVYGRESQPWVVRPLEMLRRGRFVLPAPGDGLITPVYVDDLVDAIVRALREPRAAGRAYTVWDGDTGHRARVLRLPRAVARPGRGPRACRRRCCASRRGRSAPDPPPSRSCPAAPCTRMRVHAKNCGGGRSSPSSAAWQPRWVIGPEAMETVKLDRRGGELRITLNRPDVDERLGQAVRPRPAGRRRARRRGTTMCAPWSSPAPGAAFSSGADLRPASTRRRRAIRTYRPCCTSATTRSSWACAGCRSRCWRPSTVRRSGSAARWRWPAISSSRASRPTSCSRS